MLGAHASNTAEKMQDFDVNSYGDAVWMMQQPTQEDDGNTGTTRSAGGVGSVPSELSLVGWFGLVVLSLALPEFGRMWSIRRGRMVPTCIASEAQSLKSK